MKRFVCIHGHFYQPPRENPWLEDVELQESAQPFHDWNERISSECYARNGASRVLDTQGNVVEIINNYSLMSFNIGPTLLSWMQKKDVESYQMILEADRLSRERFSGHGSALAQVYNHMIMPLANYRDKRTQIVWGIKDFESRYHRLPEGMWLAETAVDLESLDIMAEQGIKFTILAPHQAGKVKKWVEKKAINLTEQQKEESSKDLEQETVALDLRRSYWCRLPSGRKIAIFFYDGPISRAVAFEGLLHNGETLAKRVLGALDEHPQEHQLVSIATDGESYGHHHQFGDMALAYCLKYIEQYGNATLTVYGEYLEKNPPAYEVEIIENSSWSCCHGIERWRANCGCNSGGRPGWHQKWRAPLREALDWLRDESARVFEIILKEYVDDPWALRNQYIDIILNRDREHVEQFLSQHIKRDLNEEEKNKVLRCLEIQRNALLMYTSCGWFFDDISGIETVQIIKYAARVIQLVRRVGKEDLELGFIERLGKAKSNVVEADNGARIYKMYVEPSIVDILRVGAHYAMSSLYQTYQEIEKLYCFTVKRKFYEKRSAGKVELAIGQVDIVSDITLSTFQVYFAVLHLGDHSFICGVDHFTDDVSFLQMKENVFSILSLGDVSQMAKKIDMYFPAQKYSLWHLFHEEQQEILNRIFETTKQEVDTSFRRIYDDHYALIHTPYIYRALFPKVLVDVIEFVLMRDLVKLFEEPVLSLEKLSYLVKEISRWPFKKDHERLEFLISKKMAHLMRSWVKTIDRVELLDEIIAVLQIIQQLKLNLNLWTAQNIYFSIGQKQYKAKLQKDEHSPQISHWVRSFEVLGDLLKVKIEFKK